jgi:hypothetical protein
MAYKPFVATVKGADPQRFLLGEIDLQKANFMHTSDFLLEGEFREMLAKLPLDTSDAIETIIQEARQNAI